MKPYQIDRVLMHFKQAGKLKGVKGIVLGDFPECKAPIAGSPTVRDVCARILDRWDSCGLWRADWPYAASDADNSAGVNARLDARGGGTLEILEAAVIR